ncbi:hypothetical protein [Rhodococcus opacus]|uniref:hypothetical protein n=1 Tax=Rhodococcus opacus TaxID=37919 RepID=UPI0024B94BEA|nr:hypothetical protein [Rhodococcus opacus]MDJ0417171.1 hypothetical protein [Rhodococcus opacus]
MTEPIGVQSNAASTLFNLSGYRVIAVGKEPSAGRYIDIEVTAAAQCPECDAAGTRVYSSRSQRVHDIRIAG